MNTPARSHTSGFDRKGNLGSVILRAALLSVWFWLFPAELRADRAESSTTVTPLWVQRYSEVTSNASDAALQVVVDAVGDVIVTGSTDDGLDGQDILTIKYSGVNGSMIWKRRYNGPWSANDAPNALAVDRNGNVFVMGSSWKSGNTKFYTANPPSPDGPLPGERRDRASNRKVNWPAGMAVDGEG